MHLPYSYVYASAAFGFALMFVNQIVALAKGPRYRIPGPATVVQ